MSHKHYTYYLLNQRILTQLLSNKDLRNGALMKFYFTDAINNGAMNFVMWDVKLLDKKAEVKYFELHSPDN